MKKGSLVTICPNCRRVFNFSQVGFKSRQLDEDIEEVGIECRFCQHWQPSFWLNAELKSMQKENATRKERRIYEHKFKKFQAVMKKKLKAVVADNVEG